MNDAGFVWLCVFKKVRAYCGYGLVVERVLAKDESGVRFSVPAQITDLLPPGFEPGIAVPKTAVISVSPRERCTYHTSQFALGARMHA